MESQQQLLLQLFFDYNVKSVYLFILFSSSSLSLVILFPTKGNNKKFSCLDTYHLSVSLSPFSSFRRIHATFFFFFFFFFLSLSFKFLKKSLSSSARRSRLRPLRRCVRHVRQHRVDNRLRLPHRLRVRRCIRTKTGDNHQR